MELYQITQKKDFMSKLLKSDLFDGFEVREVIIHSAFKCIVDGTRNADFFAGDETAATSHFLTWKELRPYIYNLMQGCKSPSYFKIILSTDSSKTLSIAEDITASFLNIVFKENELTCSTGVAYKTFTVDKTSEQLWDDKIKHFLFKYHFL